MDVVSDLKALADSLHVVADAVASNEPEETSQPLESKAEKTSKEKEITLEEVRALLAEKAMIVYSRSQDFRKQVDLNSAR